MPLIPSNRVDTIQVVKTSHKVAAAVFLSAIGISGAALVGFGNYTYFKIAGNVNGSLNKNLNISYTNINSGQTSGARVQPIQGVAERVTNGLIAFWPINEGMRTANRPLNNNFLRDTVTPPTDITVDRLEIGNSAVWSPDGSFLNIQSDRAPVRSTRASAEKIRQAIQASNEFTVELWVRPVSSNQTGNIMSYGCEFDVCDYERSTGDASNNFYIRQENRDLVVSVRNESSRVPVRLRNIFDGNFPRFISLSWSNVNGFSRITLSSPPLASFSQGIWPSNQSRLNNWESYGIVFSGIWNGTISPSQLQTWKGEIHYAAMYSRALSDQETLQNYNWFRSCPRVTRYPDVDNDQYGSMLHMIRDCEPFLPEMISTGLDCDDTRPWNNPGANEVCDMVDNNCNGQIDDNAIGQGFWFEDRDGDGFGNPVLSPLNACTPPAGYVADGHDCNDSDPNINPNAEELCDGIDNDCRGDVDETCKTLFRRGDADGDGNVGINDGTKINNALYLGGDPLLCRDAADANDDGQLDTADALTIYSWLYLGGPEPPAPGPFDKGADPTESDTLGCEVYQ